MKEGWWGDAGKKKILMLLLLLLEKTIIKIENVQFISISFFLHPAIKQLIRRLGVNCFETKKNKRRIFFLFLFLLVHLLIKINSNSDIHLYAIIIIIMGSEQIFSPSLSFVFLKNF